MRILIAEDEAVSRRRLEALLTGWGYQVLMANDGTQAWEHLQRDDAPSLAILDWMMPELDGPEVCRRLRQRQRAGGQYVYVIVLTARAGQRDIVDGVNAGADDYLVKPYHPDELRARLNAGRRILDLQEQLIASRDALHAQATHDALTGVLTAAPSWNAWARNWPATAAPEPRSASCSVTWMTSRESMTLSATWLGMTC